MNKFVAVLSSFGVVTALATGSSPVHGQAQPPIRQVGPVLARSTDSIRLAAHIRALPGGRILVNDVARRRVVLLDSSLKLVRVVADSTSGTASAYGPRPGGLIPYRGDSTLFVDPASLSMLVVDAQGNIARVMSVPRPQEVNALTSISFGAPALDAQGRLVYRAFPSFNRVMRSAAGAGGGARQTPPEVPDSAAIVRLDLATRSLDTVAFIRIPKVSTNMSRGDDGSFTMAQTVNPLPVIDEWAVTSDGRLAIVRGRDYRIEWVDAAGTLTSTGKIPFDWQRLTDEDKVALIDSVKAQRERMAASGAAGAGSMVFGSGAAAGEAAPARVTMTMTTTGGPGGAGPTTVTSGNVRTNITYVAPSELPDYKPPFFAGAVRADADGNLWVRTIPTRAIPGGPVYDVINAKGQLVDRVQLPENREIRGFGPGNIVYMTSRGATGFVIEAARAK